MFYTVVAFIAYYIWLYRSVIVKLAYNLKFRYKLSRTFKQGNIHEMLNKLILSILILIGLLAKEEIALNEELVIASSFIITLIIIKTLVKDNANESFKERSDDQENDFVSNGKKAIEYKGHIRDVANAINKISHIVPTVEADETLKFASNNLTSDKIGNSSTKIVNKGLQVYSTSKLNNNLV
ncbi:hypothetical protein ACTFIY_002742 [Dictyostelium cf. discoideum]